VRLLGGSAPWGLFQKQEKKRNPKGRRWFGLGKERETELEVAREVLQGRQTVSYGEPGGTKL